MFVSPASTCRGGWSLCLRCEGHFTVILVPVVGARPIKHVHSRLILRTSHFRRHDRHVFQVTSSLQSWMPSLQSSVASVLELIIDSSRCVVAMSFSRLCSLSVSTRVVTLRVVFFLVPHFQNICGACFFLIQGMRFGFFRRPHSIFMCQCFHLFVPNRAAR